MTALTLAEYEKRVAGSLAGFRENPGIENLAHEHCRQTLVLGYRHLVVEECHRESVDPYDCARQIAEQEMRRVKAQRAAERSLSSALFRKTV